MSQQIIYFLAEQLIFIEVSIAFIFCFKDKNYRNMKEAYFIILSLACVYLLARLLGVFYYHEQPYAINNFSPIVPHEINNAFPSDHVAVASVFAMITYFKNRKVGIICFIFAILIGIGRVIGGVHHPIDVIAGLIIGMIAVFMAKEITAYIKRI